ncbi:MAG TPA: hypothetical protein PK625_01160 [Spirochaetales bacterium]|nr:hypothetical protein [Spirochaetales bacterium]
MSDSNNPYQSPKAEASTVASMADSGAITGLMKDYISATAPWMRFMGILGFIGVGFLAVGGLLMMFGVLGNIAGGISNVIYAAILFFPARYLYRAGSGFRQFIQDQRSDSLERDLSNNKSYWKFQGILSIIGLVMIPIAVILVGRSLFSVLMERM